MIALGSMGTAQAADIHVTTTDDELNLTDPNGDCSLREAIESVNTGSGVDSCEAGNGIDDRIILPTLPAGPYVLSILGPFEELNGTGDLDIRDNLEISGDASGSTVIDGNGLVMMDRVLHVHFGAVVVLKNLTITNGNTGGDGGGILNEGTLTVMNSTISGNAADAGGGGGIMNLFGQSFTLTDSTISGNVSASSGGGYLGFFGFFSTLTNSTIADNKAVSGGGVSSRTPRPRSPTP